MSESSESSDRSYYDRIATGMEPEWDELETPFIHTLEYMTQSNLELRKLYRLKVDVDNGVQEISDDDYDDLDEDINKTMLKTSDYFQNIAKLLHDDTLPGDKNSTPSLTFDEAVTSLQVIFESSENLHANFLHETGVDEQYTPADPRSINFTLAQLLNDLQSREHYETAIEEIGFFYLQYLADIFPVVVEPQGE